MISFNEFKKLDIRIATIKKVEMIEGADKLYKLIVSLGNEERILTAGLKPYYSPEELEGKKIVMLANLEPKKLMGIESQGMVLAAWDKGENIALLTPDKEIPDGTKIF